jgi:hypothetical protein
MNSFRVTTGQQLARISARHDGRRDVVSWSRLSEQLFRVDKWSVCRG